MINIYNFLIALKTSWIRRLILNDSKWKYLFESETNSSINELMYFGNDYTILLMERTSNLFWKDVLYSWGIVQNKAKLSERENLELHNIWYNNDIVIGEKTLFYKNYWKAGIMYINDILDKNVNFYILKISRRHLK